jgi:hypothetical protein
MSDDGNRTERGAAPAPFGTDDTLAAPVTQSSKSSLPGSAAGGLRKAEPTVTVPSASQSLPAIDRVRYKIIGEVGRGGLGRVFKARDIYLDRQVAVKELIDNAESSQRRFVREALITARLQHPAIVPIYDAGQAEEGPFYSMKLVAGRSLADALADAKTLDARLALLPSVIAVCDAMAYAHSQKIIHRDLKPQNVLVGDFGETVLIDWGLAKDLDAHEAESAGPYKASMSTTETLDGAVMGTPAFMAPEQAAPGDPVDERADVYALGSMLYYLGCGVPPHGGRTLEEILVKVMSGEIVPLREREPRIPADLAAIVTKAMAREPKHRYATAKELADDLHKFQLGKLVGAKTYTKLERFQRWTAKHRRILAVAGAALVILLAYGGWSLKRIYAERQRAEDEAERAVANAKEAEKQRDLAIARALLVRARQYAATGHAAEELAVLRVLARPDAGEASRRLAVTDGGLIWKGHQRLAMALGREVGLTLRSTDGSRFVASEPGAIVVWDAATGKELARHPFDSGGPNAARFGRIAALSPGGRFAMLATCEKPATGAAPPCGIMIADDDKFVLKPATTLELRELTTGKVHASWKGNEELRRRTIAFAADDSAIAIRRGDTIQILGARPRELSAVDCPGVAAVSPGGTHVAIACADHVRLYDPEGTATKILTGKDSAKLQLAFASSDRLLAVGAQVRLWDVAKAELRGEGKLPEAPDDSAVRDEGEDIEWQVHRLGPHGKADLAAVPQIRIGSSTSIVPRTSILGPPPRLVPGGALLTLEGPDWQAMWLDGDQLRYALVDHLVPSEPPDRCLSRIGGERHAMIALDGGTRMLIDEQELATGLAYAPPEGYRHTTTDELPVRQLRPLLAAETDACLVWGSAVGANTADGGPIGSNARAIEDADGGLLVIDREVHRISKSGKRTKVPVSELPVESPMSSHIASIDLATDTISLTPIATGQVVRTWKAEATVQTMRWATPDIVEIQTTGGAYLVSTDPAVAPRKREADLVTDPHSNYATRVVGKEAILLRAHDGSEILRHPVPEGTTARPLPDGSGSIVIEHAGMREVLTRTRMKTVLGQTKQVRIGELELVQNHLISRSDGTVAVWELSTGRAFAVPTGARDVAIVHGELWAIVGNQQPRLERIRLDGKGARPPVRLSTAGLPFHQAREELSVSSDGKRVSIIYAVTESLTAVAIWEADTGTLLWVGPPSTAVIDAWVLAGGHAYAPAFEVDQILRDTGARTNLRLCEKDLRAVPVSPPPPSDTYWAPAEACAN